MEDAKLLPEKKSFYPLPSNKHLEIRSFHWDDD